MYIGQIVNTFPGMCLIPDYILHETQHLETIGLKYNKLPETTLRWVKSKAGRISGENNKGIRRMNRFETIIADLDTARRTKIMMLEKKSREDWNRTITALNHTLSRINECIEEANEWLTLTEDKEYSVWVDSLNEERIEVETDICITQDKWTTCERCNTRGWAGYQPWYDYHLRDTKCGWSNHDDSILIERARESDKKHRDEMMNVMLGEDKDEG